MESGLVVLFVVQMLGLSKAPLWSWLDHPVTMWAGRVSYPSYLWHGWGLAISGHLVRSEPASLKFAAGYAATLGLAAGSYYVIERPFLRIKERRRENRAATPAHGEMALEHAPLVA